MNRNNSIEAFRFLFICVICLWHFSGVATFIRHGYIAVEFFFVLSGFYLYRSCKNHPEIGTLDYILHRVKKFLPPFIISFSLLILIDRKQYIYLPETITPDSILTKYFSHFHELFLCQGIGLTDRLAVNHPLWFISILLFSSGILYALLKCYKQKAIALFIPALTIIGFNYMLMNGNHSLAPFCSAFVPGLNSGIVRGVSEMGLGVLISYFCDNKLAELIKRKLLLQIATGGGIIGYMLMILANDNYDYLALFFAPLIIVCCNIKGTLFQKCLDFRSFGWLGGLSMYMFFIHLFVAYIFWILSDYYQNIPNFIIVIAYLISVTLAAFVLKIVSNKFSARLG